MAGAQCRKCNGRIFGRPALTVAAWVGIDPCLLLVGIPNAVRSGLVPVRPKVGRLEEPSTDRLSRSAEEVAHRCVDVIVDGSVGHQACSVAEVGGPPPQHCVEPVTDLGPRIMVARRRWLQVHLGFAFPRGLSEAVLFWPRPTRWCRIGPVGRRKT
jgi:hypothetical protein